ncbi:Hsp70 family protein [Dactylosporangium sp. NBC_01737]|uniref:Hsp70 family protein n=1 Tax=Dactylosporangium sp. NBC_01737 TaxID=2975959 RepID=UPI002E0EE762|nr:Hsp70 family protein [Dactylosporangium sp. NBC_01737]
MDARGYRLGIDFGTSNTAAMLAWPDGHVRPLLFDGSPTLPSAVYADPQTGLLVGRDAVHAARVSPERFEPNPKRRIDESSVLLGDHEVATVDLFAAVLARVNGEAQRVAGGQIGQVTITCPAAWAHTRRGVLLAAAERAGLGTVTLVPEPVAAAEVFRTLDGTDVRPGSAFVVYDLGAGTFDASVVRHGPGTFEVLAAEGLSTSGGLDIDAAIVGYLGASQSTRDPASWNRLVHPTTSAERRANRLLWDDVRAAKEMLSRTSSTMIHIPMYDEDVPLGRDQFEQLARPILAATVTATRAAIAAARLTPADVAGVFLVGGGSRIPLVATLLHQALGKAPTAVEQPEMVVAQGSLGVPAQAGPAGQAPPASGFPVSAPPVSSAPVSSSPVSGPGFPASAPPASAPTSVSGSVSMPVSGVPMSAAPVSPGFSASPVSSQPSSQFAQDAGYTPPSGYAAPPGPAQPSPAHPSPAHPSTAQQSPAQPFPAAQQSPGYPPPAAHQSPTPSFAPAPSSPAQPPTQPPAPGRASVPPTGYGAASQAAPPPPPRPAAQPAPAAGGGQRRTGVLAAVAVVVLLVVGLGIYGLTKLGGDDGGKDNTSSQTEGPDGGGGETGETTEPPAQVDAERDDSNWSTTAKEYEGYEGKLIRYTCPKNGKPGDVWGNGPYTTDSSVCTAAVHAGYLQLDEGGTTIIQIRKGSESYEGSTQFNITTKSWDAYDWEFTIAG